MVAIYKAPELCQYADEQLIVQMGAIISPDIIYRHPVENGLSISVEGDYTDRSVIQIASDQFQILLGVLRVWNPIAGQRRDEVNPGIGSNVSRDKAGNQAVLVGTAIEYQASEDQINTFAHDTKLALDYSHNLRNTLWLNGRRDRNAADFYMIFEYAKKEFGDRKKMVQALKVSDNDISRLTRSANNLAPIDGGRHAMGTGEAVWTLDDQNKFISRLLRNWINYRVSNPAEEKNTQQNA